MIIKTKWLFTALTVALILVSCNRKVIYHHYEHTSLAGWEKDDTLRFSVHAAEQRAVVRREIELRITDAYPFRGLNLVVDQTSFPSHIHRRDTLQCDLIDARGNVHGDGINLYQYRFHLADISINEGDSLSICILHNMKREVLPGIADVGVRLTTY